MRPSSEPPFLPSHERELYRASSRAYADAFYLTFVDPVRARFRFREAVRWNGLDEALRRIGLHPDELGPRMPYRPAKTVRHPAFIYWTQRERRPRALLRRVVAALHDEASHRDYTARLIEARRQSDRLGWEWGNCRAYREHRIEAVRTLRSHAAQVYADPARACRAMLRTIRKHGAPHARTLLEQTPQCFGHLRAVPHDGWLGVLGVTSTEEAKARLPAFLTRAFDPAVRARESGFTAGALLRAAEQGAAAHKHYDALAAEPKPEPGALDEAARLLATLCRRRDVDERPRGEGPPTLSKQLSAMLPEHMAGLIVEALKLSHKKSGDDPEWTHRDGRNSELARSLGHELKPARNWSRGRSTGMER